MRYFIDGLKIGFLGDKKGGVVFRWARQINSKIADLQVVENTESSFSVKSRFTELQVYINTLIGPLPYLDKSSWLKAKKGIFTKSLIL